MGETRKGIGQLQVVGERSLRGGGFPREAISPLGQGDCFTAKASDEYIRARNDAKKSKCVCPAERSGRL